MAHTQKRHPLCWLGLPDHQVQPLFLFPARPQVTGLPASDDSEFRVLLDQIVSSFLIKINEESAITIMFTVPS